MDLRRLTQNTGCRLLRGDALTEITSVCCDSRCAGCRAAPLTALPTLLPGFDAVINTVPAPVLPRALLQQLPGGALIIDLASLPGGTDFAAAEELGLHAEHALALPGRCAPQTAGALIAQTVLAILEERDPDERSTAP